MSGDDDSQNKRSGGMRVESNDVELLVFDVED